MIIRGSNGNHVVQSGRRENICREHGGSTPTDRPVRKQRSRVTSARIDCHGGSPDTGPGGGISPPEGMAIAIQCIRENKTCGDRHNILHCSRNGGLSVIIVTPSYYSAVALEGERMVTIDRNS